MSFERPESFVPPPNVDPEKHITRPYKCPHCGYDLRYAPIAGVCSECGNIYNSRSATGEAALRAAVPKVVDIDYPPGVSPDRHIVSALYCGGCGYLLKYAPLTGQCPECGHEYNARGTLAQGVFRAGSIRVPGWEIFVGSIMAWFAWHMVRAGMSPIVVWRLIIGGVAAALALGCLCAAARRRSASDPLSTRPPPHSGNR